MTHTFAIVGYGTQGVYHWKNLGKIDGATVKGIFDIDPRANDDAEKAQLHVYHSMDEVLSDSDIDFVFICTPNDVHHDYAVRSLRAGKNVLCEKPAMLNSAEMEDVDREAQAARKLFMVHQNRRWDPDFQIIKKIYDEEIIGKATYLEQRIHGSRGIPGDWRQLPERGGGMILDWGVHTVDRLLRMVDSPVVDVYGKRSFVAGHKVDDGFKAYFTFANGFEALVDVSTNAYVTLPKFYIQSATGTAVIEDWDMHGKIVRRTGAPEEDAKPIQAGVGLTKTMAPRILDYSQMAKTTPPVEVLPLPEVHTDVMEFYRNALAAAEGKAEPVISNASVLRCLKILEAIVKSDETHEIVHPEKA